MIPSSTTPLSPIQRDLARRPLDAKIFLEGPAGTGKTTAGRERLRFLLDAGVPPGEILLLVPQLILAAPYEPAFEIDRGNGPEFPSEDEGGDLARRGMTLAGLAQRSIDRFWQQVAAQAGFTAPDQPPVFLNIETAQYFLARVAAPLLEQGAFSSVVLERKGLYSQILNNLNRAASVGFPYTEIGERLKAAWTGASGRARAYDEVQACASRFRQYCLEYNLLDFSLQVEVFTRYLWPLPACRRWLLETYRHLIVDNLEENVPVLHDLLGEWLPGCDSALLIYDWEAGYRTILSADPVTGYELKGQCQESLTFAEPLVASPELEAWIPRLAWALNRQQAILPAVELFKVNRPRLPAESVSGMADMQVREQPGDYRLPPTTPVVVEARRLYPQMLDWVADQAGALVHDAGLPPAEIAILAPFVSDSLRFSLDQRLRNRGLVMSSHRPSRPLRDEPPVQCLLTLAALAHPGWGILPAQADVRDALVQAIRGMDPVRAGLLAEIVYRVRDGMSFLTSFERIRGAMQERITLELGGRYEELRLWLEEYGRQPEANFDRFLMRLFAEVLSAPGFGYEGDEQAGRTAANLVDSARNFQGAAGEMLAQAGLSVGKEFLAAVGEGLMSASYLRGWQPQPGEAVFLAPVATFLSSNRSASVQFWLNAGSPAWYERPDQPLGHPYVLSRHWLPGRPWTDMEEYETAQETLYRLAAGLIRRCRERIYLGYSELSEQGYDQRGMLWRAVEKVIGRLNDSTNLSG